MTGQPTSRGEEMKAQPTHLAQNTEGSQTWPGTSPNAIDKQTWGKKTNFYYFFLEMDEILVLLKCKAKFSI